MKLRSLSLLLISLVSIAPALSASGHSHAAIEPVLRSESKWQERHNLLNDRAAKEGAKAQIVFLGDSITEGWENEGKDVWARYYAPRGALNLGIGGDQTQHLLWRMDHGNLEGVNPKLGVLHIGTNNIALDSSCVPAIIDGVTAVVHRFREKYPEAKLLLLAIMPREEFPNVFRGWLLQVNQSLVKLADGKQVIWVDLGSGYVRTDGSIPSELMYDHLHLTPKGYALWATAIEPEVSRILGDATVAPAQP